MTSKHDDYKQMVLPSQYVLEPCPVCSGPAQLWQYSEDETSPVKKLACCKHGDPVGPAIGLVGGGCPLYMPPDQFMRATIREAVNFWNEYAKALRALRLHNESVASGAKAEPTAT